MFVLTEKGEPPSLFSWILLARWVREIYRVRMSDFLLYKEDIVVENQIYILIIS